MGVVLQIPQEVNSVISHGSIWCSTDSMPILISMDMLPFFVVTPETNRCPCIHFTVIFCWESPIRSEKFDKTKNTTTLNHSCSYFSLVMKVQL